MSARGDLVLRNARLVYAEGEIVAGGLVASGGVISEVFAGDGPSAASGVREVDAAGRHVLPGLIDPHVQLIPDPDFAQYATETRSAALGGVTTIVKMHRDLEGYPADPFWEEVAGAERRAHVDFSFHLAVMTDEQIVAIPDYARDLELTSFKLFMAYRGEEGYRLGIQGVDDARLFEAFEAVARVGGVALVHCENQDIVNRSIELVLASGRDGLRAFAETRPAIAEAEAVQRASFLAHAACCPLYVVHVSAADSVAALVAARQAGTTLYVETAPHYLTQTCDSPAGNLAKVNPPVREAEDAEALWLALGQGEVDTIGSDHIGRGREGKDGTVWDAQLGFPGIATILPVLLSEGVNRGRLSVSRLAAATSTNAARIFGLPGKGDLRPGKDADFVVVDLDLERIVDAADLGSSADFSVWEGRTLRGWPVLTACRGEVVMEHGELVGQEGRGRYLRRPTAEEASR